MRQSLFHLNSDPAACTADRRSTGTESGVRPITARPDSTSFNKIATTQDPLAITSGDRAGHIFERFGPFNLRFQHCHRVHEATRNHLRLNTELTHGAL